MEKANPFTEFELKLFERHFRLPGFSGENQQRIKESSVILIGAGGLGNVVAQHLAAAGIGKLTLVDFDTIEISNISRQLLFSESDIGNNKAVVATDKLSKQYPSTQFRCSEQKFDDTCGAELCPGNDLIIDCSDVRSAKYSIDRVASSLAIPLVFGAVSRFDGQVSVFHGRSSASYSRAFPKANDSQDDGCGALGIWAPAVGIIGSIMAQEALNMLAFGASPLDGKLLQVDLKNYQFQLFEIAPMHRDRTLKFPGLPESIQAIRENELSDITTKEPGALSILITEESETTSNGLHLCITMNDVIWQSADWEKERPIILQCPSGKRSLEAALLLSGQGFRKLYAVFPD